jgi:DNA topoisomerase VI subunit A
LASNVESKKGSAVVFRITGTDRREELLKTKGKVTAQALGGRDIDYFSSETGFVLLRKTRQYSTEAMPLTRVLALCKLMQDNLPMGLRDGYYTIRQTPTLTVPFKGVKDIYSAYLHSINDMEIIADVERSVFFEGKFPKGIIYYPFNTTYGNTDKFIGFTENIARSVLKAEDVEHACNIVAIEKGAATVPLAEGKFSRLTNSLLVTTGGFYTRGISQLIQRFMNDKNVWLWTDGDVWGVYMREVIRLGSMTSRHLDDKIRHANVINAGLKPSIARELGLPNDTEEKRPLEKPEARERIALLKRIGFPKEDIKVFEDNYTFELEALKTAFRDKSGKRQIGQELYLTKLMELMDKDVKPIPDWTSETLQNRAEDILRTTLYGVLMRKLAFKDELKSVIIDVVEKRVQKIIDAAVNGVLDELKDRLDLKREDILHLVYEYYRADMEGREYIDLGDIIRKAYGIKVTTKPINVDAIKADLAKTVEEILDSLSIKASAETNNIDIPDTEKGDLYRQIYKELAIKPEDEKKMDKVLRGFV